ncbi:MAG: cupin domain-containing protein [Moorea sp. SIO1G6]|uniref:cupin domain-containing protein n=1 Tax=Moorena sp. SIO1G6 TaxID=2607840 RepID=UPI0013BFE077|nr:cupin domain-containing protein [Moorena sp. SIO1G6]NES81687.1 cupin domain-containing protein [Moorena sp. SIO2B7]NET68646.1 cupin domain-containing protein [Moorena sp. SIO1G6]
MARLPNQFYTIFVVTSNLKIMNELEVKLGLKKLKQEWEPKGFKCDTYTSAPGEFWSNPGHKTDEYIILIEGDLEISFQGKTYNPAIGEILKVPARVPHIFGNPGQTSNCVYWIYAFDWQWNEDGSGTEEGRILSRIDG